MQCTLTCCCCFVACDVEGLFEKKEIPRDEIDAKNLQKSPLTLQIEEMKDEEHNPFSQYARYDGKVKVTLSIMWNMRDCKNILFERRWLLVSQRSRWESTWRWHLPRNELTPWKWRCLLRRRLRISSVLFVGNTLATAASLNYSQFFLFPFSSHTDSMKRKRLNSFWMFLF